MNQKGISSAVVIAIVAALLIVGGGVYYAVKQMPAVEDNNAAMMPKEDAEIMVKPEETMMKDETKGEAMMEKPAEEAAMQKPAGETMMKDEPKMMATSGTYQAYSADKLALASDGHVLLFFHAEWCQTCRTIESEIKASPTALPAGVHILKVDYDNATDLRQKYGVTVQHTFVEVDAQGKLIQKWSDTSTLAGALGKI